MKNDISIIIPVYNEERCIEGFISELNACSAHSDKICELVIVDDGSTDGTYSILNTIKRDGIAVIRHESNKGYGAALKTGIGCANGEFICIIDGDNSYLPQDIWKLTAYMNEQDMVVGARLNGSAFRFPLHQRVAKGLVCFILKMCFNKEILDINSGLRMMRADMAKKYMSLLPDGFSFTASITLISLLEKVRIMYVPISYKKRVGRSKVSIIDYVVKFIISYRNILSWKYLRGRPQKERPR